MNILSITAQKPDSTGSGVYLSELVKNFAKMGHKQAVVAGIYPEDSPEFANRTAFYPVYFKSESIPFPIVGMSDEMPYESTRYCDMTEDMVEQFSAAFLKEIQKAVTEFEPDLILCHHLYLLTAIVREYFPEHRIYGFCHNTDLRQIRKTAQKREYIVGMIPKLNRIFVPQEAQRKGVLELFPVNDKVLEPLGMGYNRNIFYPDDKALPEDGVKRLVFAGKIAQKKGVISLLNSLSHLPYPKDQLILQLAGGAGNELEYKAIQKLAEKSRYKVEFLGRLPQKDLARVYTQSDVFVLPSFFDGLPLVIIEALACKMKVVVTDLPGVRQWLEDSVPGAPVWYVAMPRMKNTDEPELSDLPAFERELSLRIAESVAAPRQTALDMHRISWENICERILEIS